MIRILFVGDIMGGAGSGVTKTTRDILLESAFFSPMAITGKARSYGLHTDSSHRFERGVDYELQRRAMEREIAVTIQQALDDLPDDLRTAITLRELEGLPCTEIAEIVGATHVTVRWRLHRGRKLFQEEWERRERLAVEPRRLHRLGAEDHDQAQQEERAESHYCETARGR